MNNKFVVVFQIVKEKSSMAPKVAKRKLEPESKESPKKRLEPKFKVERKEHPLQMADKGQTHYAAV
jgi:hypothetical protein